MKGEVRCVWEAPLHSRATHIRGQTKRAEWGRSGGGVGEASARSCVILEAGSYPVDINVCVGGGANLENKLKGSKVKVNMS